MNILFLAPHPFFQLRGTPLAEKALIEVLTAKGHRVVVLTYPEGEDPAIPGCRIERLPGRFLPRGVRAGLSWKKLLSDAFMLPRAVWLARRSDFDLVHAVEESAFMALCVRRLVGVPYVYDMDSALSEQSASQWPVLRWIAPLLRRCEAAAVRGSVAVLADCAAVEALARDLAPDALVGRIENPSLLSGALTAPGPGPAPPVVMYVGNLEPYQGVGLLLRAFALALPEVPEARLVLVGGDARRLRRYARLAADLGIARAVEWRAPVPLEALGEALSQASVVVSPRISGSNIPLKIFSCLDSGRVLLATAIGAHLAVLDPDVAALVEPEPRAFAAGLVALLRDPERRVRLATAARRRVHEAHGRSAFVARAGTFYDQVGAALSRSDAAPTANPG